MQDRERLRGFRRLAESLTEAELIERHATLQLQLLDAAQFPDVEATIRICIQIVEQELQVFADLNELKRQKQK